MLKVKDSVGMTLSTYQALKSVVARKLYLLGMIQLDTEGVVDRGFLEFVVSDLVAERLYADAESANEGLGKGVPVLMKLRDQNKNPIFIRVEREAGFCRLFLNPKRRDADGTVAWGFRVFPKWLLGVNSMPPTSRMRDIAFAVFRFAQWHVGDLAAGESLYLGYKSISEALEMPEVTAANNYLGRNRVRLPLDNGIAAFSALCRAHGLDLVVTPERVDSENIVEYLEKSRLKVEIKGRTLENFLVPFGLAPEKNAEAEKAVASKKIMTATENSILPWPQETLGFAGCYGAAALDALMDESDAGCRCFDLLSYAAVSGTQLDIDRHKKELERCRAVVREALIDLEMRHCRECGFISEYWRAFYECRQECAVLNIDKRGKRDDIDERLEQVTDYYPRAWWVLVKDFVSRLNEAKLLGDLADVDTIKLRLKPDWTAWTVEELEKTVAKVEAWERQERKTVSC